MRLRFPVDPRSEVVFGSSFAGDSHATDVLLVIQHGKLDIDRANPSCYVPRKAFRIHCFLDVWWWSAWVKTISVCVCEGCLQVWDAVVCWPRAAVGETVHLLCPAVFSLFKNNTGVTHIHTIHIKLVHDSKLKLKMTVQYLNVN